MKGGGAPGASKSPSLTPGSALVFYTEPCLRATKTMKVYLLVMMRAAIVFSKGGQPLAPAGVPAPLSLPLPAQASSINPYWHTVSLELRIFRLEPNRLHHNRQHKINKCMDITVMWSQCSDKLLRFFACTVPAIETMIVLVT